MDDVLATPFRLLIDGELRDGAAQMEVINPATGAVLTECARADAVQLDEAVAAANAAFPAWSTTPVPSARGAFTPLPTRWKRRPMHSPGC